MVYKDLDKRRVATQERVRRYRLRQKGVTKGVTSEGVTLKGVTESVEPAQDYKPPLTKERQVSQRGFNE